jgi:hypothetical protein
LVKPGTACEQDVRNAASDHPPVLLARIPQGSRVVLTFQLKALLEEFHGRSICHGSQRRRIGDLTRSIFSLNILALVRGTV